MTTETIEFGEDIYIEKEFEVPGEDEKFTLRTVTGGDAIDFVKTRATYRKEERSMIDLQTLLLDMSIRDKKGEKIGEERIRTWPFPLQSRLYFRALEMSRVNDEQVFSRIVVKAFEEHDPPISLQDLRTWLNGLEGDEFKLLKLLFAPTDEELAKNSRNGSTGGSG